MAQEIRIVVNQLVEEARKEIEEISAGEALKLLDVDNVVIVDVRDARELQCVGKILGSFHAPRGILEFRVDPASPYFKNIFAQDKKFVFHCASGWRSALAARIVQRMGQKPVAHIATDFSGWKKAEGASREDESTLVGVVDLIGSLTWKEYCNNPVNWCSHAGSGIAAFCNFAKLRTDSSANLRQVRCHTVDNNGR